MNFRAIFFKMFKSNIRRYILYILCSAFTIMIVFLYLTMYTNKDFKDSSKVNDLISSNLYTPSLVLAIFSICFIIYVHNYFMKFRNKDFALFMILGITNNDIRKCSNCHHIYVNRYYYRYPVFKNILFYCNETD